VGESVGTPAHTALVQEVADRSLTLLRNEGILPVAADRPASAVNIVVQKNDAYPSPAALAAKLTAAFPGIKNFTLRPDLDPAVYTRAWQAAAETDLVILSLFIQRNRLGEAAPPSTGKANHGFPAVMEDCLPTCGDSG